MLQYYIYITLDPLKVVLFKLIGYLLKSCFPIDDIFIFYKYTWNDSDTCLYKKLLLLPPIISSPETI